MPKGGKPGMIIEARNKDADPLEQLLAVNTFRHDLAKASSSQDAWQYLLLVASCLFFGDVFFRRVQVNFGLGAAAGRPGARLAPAPSAEARHARVHGTAARQKSRSHRSKSSNCAARSASKCRKPQKPADLTVLEEPAGADKPSKPAEKPSITTPEKTEEESYTERLLRRKRKSGKTAIKNKTMYVRLQFM